MPESREIRSEATIFLTYPASPADCRRWFKARDAGGNAATPYYDTESRVFVSRRFESNQLKTLDSGLNPEWRLAPPYLIARRHITVTPAAPAKQNAGVTKAGAAVTVNHQREADGGTPSFPQDRGNPEATDGNTRHRRVTSTVTPAVR